MVDSPVPSGKGQRAVEKWCSVIGVTRTLSVVGPGRSGSTIVASILGATSGVASAGEVRWLWRRGVVEERPCGCGEPPARCPVWSRVLERTDGMLEEVLRAQQEISARRNRYRVLRSASSPCTTWPAMAVMRAVTAEATAALAETVGATLVVDTSKRPQDAAVLAGSRSVDHYVLHLVRDPRAVAYSWGRSKASNDAPGARMMGTRTPASSAARWVENALGAELLRRRVSADRWIQLRYEDFVASPQATVARVLDAVRHDARPPFVAPDTVVLGANHIVAGNPSRFRTGNVRIREDDEWRDRLSLADQRRVEMITAPLLARYGYPRRAR